MTDRPTETPVSAAVVPLPAADTGPNDPPPFAVTLPWGMSVRLHLDGGQPWLEIRDEDDGSGAATALTPESLRLLAEHAARLAGLAVVAFPAPKRLPPAWEPASPQGLYWKVEPCEDDDGPFIHVLPPGFDSGLDVQQAREFFLAGLAACAEADRRAGDPR